MDQSDAREYTDDWSKVCGWCEGPIGGTHPNRQYCGSSCKNKAKRVRSYGLEPAEYKQLLDATDGKCPICRKNITRWNIDHDHTTGETTGLVCVTCNNAVLAFTYHDPDTARRLVEFLENPPVRQLFGERRVTKTHKNQKPNGVLPMFLRK